MKARRGLVLAVGLTAGCGLLGWGCGKPVLRVADASLGDYYTEKEYRKLHEEDRLAYCEELAMQDSIYREEIAEARAAAARHQARAAGARVAADSLGRLADSLEVALAARAVAQPSASRAANRPATRPSPGPSGAGERSITVRGGDSLWRISARDSVYGDGSRWKDLYEANRDRIRDADRIYPGQELNAPR